MVHFGTSGWRGIVGREITFRRVRAVTQAIVDVLKANASDPDLILVGYDTRMLSEKFAASAAQLIAGNGLSVSLPVRDIPAPVLSSAIRERGAAGGILFTASHNPPEYNGLKFYTRDGILASTALTDQVEERYRALEPTFADVYLPRPELLGRYDPRPVYLDRLQELIDWEAIRSSGITLVVDPLFGSSREYLDHILLENQIPVTVIHNTRDPFFGGYAPECTSENLGRLRDVMRSTHADLGLSTDADGDRFGILDRGARLKESSPTLALVLDYLARRRGFTGAVGRTVATSTLIDAVARDHGLEVVETPVGFKNFGPMLVDGTLEYAAEESAGLAWTRNLPERDGILACLLVAEMVAVEGRTLYDLAQELHERVGAHFFRRVQVPLTHAVDRVLERRLEQEWTTVDGRTVAAVDRRDGLKLSFDGGGWILIRRAGTEPKVRLYAEGPTKEEMRYLLHLARKLLTNWRM
jgi:alpha-D-glucose phosphate-specific phosphoglucomutase